MEKTYNGWTNYPTWRINLEAVDGVHYEESGVEYKDVHELAEAIKENTELLLDDEAGIELAKSYALAFIADVNWHEIAKNMIESNPKLLKNHA